MSKLVLFIIIALSVCMLWGSINEIQLSMPNQNTTNGSEISIPITTNNLTGNGVISYEINISYNANLLGFISVVKTNSISSPGMVNSNCSNGVLHIGAIFSQPLTGSGTLLWVKFQALQAGTAQVNFTSAIMNTTPLQYLLNGNIYIDTQPESVHISVADFLCPAGTEISIPITVNGVSMMNCTSFQFKLSYNPNVLTLNNISSIDCISQGWNINFRNQDGMLQVAGIGVIPFSQDGILIKLNFQIMPTVFMNSNLNIHDAFFNAMTPSEITNGRLDVYDINQLEFSGVTNNTHILVSDVLCTWVVENTSINEAEVQFQAGTNDEWSVAELYSSDWLLNYDSQILHNLVPGSDIIIRARMRIGNIVSDWIQLSGHLNMLPPLPQLISPQNNRLWNQPLLSLQCSEAMDTDGDTITYYFETQINNFANENLSTSPLINISINDNEVVTWRVRISDGYQDSGWSEPWIVLVNYINQSPVVINPYSSISFTENTTYPLDLSTVFDDQDLYFGDHLSFSAIPSTHISIDLNQNIATLQPESDWFGSESIILTAQDDSMCVAIDTVLVIIRHLPQPATLNTPQDGQVYVHPRPVFSWNAGIGPIPLGYKLCLGTNNPPDNVLNGLDLNSATSWQPSYDLQFNTTYYWRIVPYTEDAEAENCPVWSFQTVAENVVYQFPYIKNFEDNVLLSGGWTNINQGVSIGNWRMNNSYGVNSSKCVSVGRNPGTYWFISPTIICPEQGNVFSFSLRDLSSTPAYDRTDEFLYILVSTSGINTSDFTNTIAVLSNQEISTVHTVFSYDLHQFAGQVINIAFKRVANNGNYNYVDNIQITNAVPILPPIPSEYHFPVAKIGSSSQAIFNLNNMGSGILVGNAVYSEGFTGTTALHGKNPILTISYNPTSNGVVQGSVSITSNGGNCSMNLAGNAGWNANRCDSSENNGFAFYPSVQDWTFNETQKNSGLASLSPDVENATILTPWINISHESSIGFWAKASISGSVELKVNASDQRDIQSYGSFYSQSLSSSWQYYQVSLESFIGQVISISIHLDAGSFIDDIDLPQYQVPLPPQVTMIKNGSNIRLEWPSTAKITGYQVLRSNNLENWESISPTNYENANWLIEDANPAIFYKVYSVNGEFE